jgi:hypothetical protein
MEAVTEPLPNEEDTQCSLRVSPWPWNGVVNLVIAIGSIASNHVECFLKRSTHGLYAQVHTSCMCKGQ